MWDTGFGYANTSSTERVLDFSLACERCESFVKDVLLSMVPRSIWQALPTCFSHLFSTSSRDLCLGCAISESPNGSSIFEMNSNVTNLMIIKWFILMIIMISMVYRDKYVAKSLHQPWSTPLLEVQHTSVLRCFFSKSWNLEIQGRRRDVLCCVAAHRCPSCGIHDGLIRLGHWCSGAST